MRYVICNAAYYEKVLSKYEADIYIKGRDEILKSNALIHFVHMFIPCKRKDGYAVRKFSVILNTLLPIFINIKSRQLTGTAFRIKKSSRRVWLF
jgi:hypothetical protein